MQAVITMVQVLVQEEGNLMPKHGMLYRCISLHSVNSSSLNIPFLVTSIDLQEKP